MKSIQNISEIIKHLNEISSGIAAAVEEQNATTNEIARNVASASSQTGRLSSGVRSSAMIADESTKNIHSISKESEKAASFAKTTRDSAVGLADLAAKLNKIVIQFKLHKTALKDFMGKVFEARNRHLGQNHDPGINNNRKKSFLDSEEIYRLSKLFEQGIINESEFIDAKKQ